MFPGSGKRTRRLLLTGLFTGTIGIFLLLTFQLLAALPRGFRIGGRGLGIVIFLVLHLIGYSYRCASDPDIGFWGSFFGFTVGVGLCEELCKALPIWYYLVNARKTGWRGACLVGLASGIGFGVSEGIMYSGDMYNGIYGIQIYLVRFLSCVSLHAMWSGSVALMMYKNQDFLDVEGIVGFIVGIGYYLGAVMILHGLYDTLLKHELPYVALLIGFGSYFWLFKLVADSRGT
ncbi:MAG: PrsW family glutamic-type intramembrane protease [Planctomycetota bacterium]